MKFLPYISANLWRRPIRTLFTFMSLVFGFMLLGLAFGLHSSLRNMAKSARADRIYTSPQFAGRLGLPQLEQIARLPGVSKVGGMDAISGYFQKPSNRMAVLMPSNGMRAVFPELPLTEPQWRQLAITRDGAFFSEVIAKKYGLKAGSRFPLIAPSIARADGTNLWTFQVLGVVPEIALMPVGFAIGNYDYLDQSRPRSDQGGVGQIWVIANSDGGSEAVIKTIDDSFANSGVATRSVSEKAMLESAGGSGSDSLLAILAFALVGVLMIAFLTSNAIRHSIGERTRELAVLKTLGFSNRSVTRLILAEAAAPCLLGCLVGLTLAAGVASILPFITPPGFVLPEPDVGLSVMSSAIGIALVIALLSAVLPARRITRLDVATALARH